jgi:hypothetical protein
MKKTHLKKDRTAQMKQTYTETMMQESEAEHKQNTYLRSR